MNKTTFLQTAARLFSRVPGPVAAIWGICTAAQIALTSLLVAQGATFFTTLNTPDPKTTAGLLLAMWVVDAFQKGLYRPMRHLARSDEQLTIGTVIGSSAGRMSKVMGTQILTGIIMIITTLICVMIGGNFAFVPIYFLSFSLAPALYFAAARGDSAGKSIQKSLSAAYRHWRYVLGVPALFLCLSPLLGPDSLTTLASDIMAGDKLTFLQMTFFYILYRYTYWLATSSVYVAIDENA